jgi:RING-box protein 1
MVNINWIKPIGYWYYVLNQQDCSICRTSLDKPAIGFENNSENIEEYTTIVTSSCQHSYHMLCINKWLKTRHVCPMCNIPWKEQSKQET